MLAGWADVIVVTADEGVLKRIPSKFSHKTSWANVGPDQWGNPMHPELLEIMKQVAVNVLGG
jgi:hypothetical protein